MEIDDDDAPPTLVNIQDTTINNEEATLQNNIKVPITIVTGENR